MSPDRGHQFGMYSTGFFPSESFLCGNVFVLISNPVVRYKRKLLPRNRMSSLEPRRSIAPSQAEKGSDTTIMSGERNNGSYEAIAD